MVEGGNWKLGQAAFLNDFGTFLHGFGAFFFRVQEFELFFLKTVPPATCSPPLIGRVLISQIMRSGASLKMERRPTLSNVRSFEGPRALRRRTLESGDILFSV